MKRYIVQLDNDKYGWTFLWGFTIREIKKHCTRLEILSTIMPLLMIETNESSFVIKNIEGVKHIEEECKGYASLGKEDINQEKYSTAEVVAILTKHPTFKFRTNLKNSYDQIFMFCGNASPTTMLFEMKSVNYCIPPTVRSLGLDWEWELVDMKSF